MLQDPFILNIETGRERSDRVDFLMRRTFTIGQGLCFVEKSTLSNLPES